MKIAQGLKWFFAVIFLLFAYWQLNDPDPWLWIPIYVLVSVVSGLSVFRSVGKIPLYIAAVYLVGAAFIFPAVEFAENWVEVEEDREFMGLVICAIWLSFLYVTDLLTSKD